MLKLLRPSSLYLFSALAACEEYTSDKSTFQIMAVDKMIEGLKNNPDDYFQKLYKEENGIDLKSGWVPATTFWLIDDDQYIGSFVLRHALTDELKLRGGHIAYQIRPSKCRQGYATKGLLLCLSEALKLGLDQVLITCREDNIASYKTIMKAMIKMGGHEIALSETDGHKNHRVWIKT